MSVLASSAGAVPVEWTLNGFTFQDGGTASGSFFVDTETCATSNINVTTSGGSYPFGGLYTTGSPGGFVTEFIRDIPAGRSVLFIGSVRSGSCATPGTPIELGLLLENITNERFFPDSPGGTPALRNLAATNGVFGTLTSSPLVGGGMGGGGGMGEGRDASPCSTSGRGLADAGRARRALWPPPAERLAPYDNRVSGGLVGPP